MRANWTKTVGLVAITTASALLASANFFSQQEKSSRDQYDEERLQNDSLMGAIQTLHKQLGEKEQELRERNSLIDSLAHTCDGADDGDDPAR